MDSGHFARLEVIVKEVCSEIKDCVLLCCLTVMACCILYCLTFHITISYIGE